MNGSKTGGCMCGAVRYELAQAPTEFGACHCGMCRKFSGGIELSLEVPRSGIQWRGEDNIQTYKSSDWAERGFCKICGSSLLWRMTADGPHAGMLSLSAGTLDSLNGLSLSHEIYIDQKPDAYSFSGHRKQMTQAQVEAQFSAPKGEDR